MSAIRLPPKDYGMTKSAMSENTTALQSRSATPKHGRYQGGCFFKPHNHLEGDKAISKKMQQIHNGRFIPLELLKHILRFTQIPCKLHI